jgi:EmrB/QacA subfamily drug resistance transporter
MTQVPSGGVNAGPRVNAGKGPLPGLSALAPRAAAESAEAMTTHTRDIPAARPEAAEPSPARWLALAVLCVSLLMVTLDNTVLNVALPTLERDLHATTTELQWIVDAYVVVFAGLLLVMGSLADRIGRKRVFLAGLAAFAAGSAWAAFSGSVGLLIAARASMGVGGAMMMPSTLAIITAVFRDPAERQRAIGLWAGTTGLGVSLGPIIGGLLLAHFWWGSVFLINVPIAVVGAACALPLIPESKNPAALRPDFAGALLSIGGLGLLLWSLIEAPVRGWSSPVTIAAGIGGLAVITAFVLWERASSHPMLNLGFFRRRRFSAAVGSVGLATFGLFGALFVLTQFLQFVLGYTPLEAGIRVLPAAGAIAVVAPLSTLLVRAAGTKVTVAAGLLIVAGGLWQLSTASATTTFTGILPGLVLLGVGAGLTIPSATESVMGSLPSGHTGVGSATNGAFLQTGGALGVAVIGSLLNTRYQDHMTSALTPYLSHYPALHALMDTILGSVGAALAVAAHAGGLFGAALGHLADSAFASGMDLGLAAAACVAAAGCLIALLALPSRAAEEARPETTEDGPDHSLRCNASG